MSPVKLSRLRRSPAPESAEPAAASPAGPALQVYRAGRRLIGTLISSSPS